MQTLWQDLRYAARMLTKSPGFLAVSVLTLAMAIGANAVVFSVLNALILHPLHVPNADTLWGIQHGNETSLYQSYPDYLDLRDRNKSFQGLAAFSINEAAIDIGDNPSRIWLAEVSGNYFDMLGVQPYLGRVFHPSDEGGPNSAPYIVLGYSYWHTHFQDDRNVVGRVIQLSKHPFTVVGVAPPEFHGTLVFFDADLFVPIVNAEQLDNGNDLSARRNRWVFMTLGHLKPGVTRAQASADLNSVGAYLEKTYPKEDAQRTFILARPSLYGDYLGRPMLAFMGALMLLAALILLAACANLGGLFAARAADRSRELALRLALGAPRLRLLQQLFTEAGLLSIIGGAVGIWGSVAMLHALSLWRPASKWPEMHLAVNPDANVYGVALLMTLVSGLLFGAVPVRQVLRTDPYSIVKAGSIGTVGRRITVRELLLGVQIALCAVLITSSFVAVRGLIRSLHSDLGFRPQNALLVDTDLSMAGYRGENVPEMQQRMIDSLGAIPGVQAVGLVDNAPLVAGGYEGSLVFDDSATDFKPSNAAANSLLFSISPEYFRAAGTTLLSGRTFTRHDDRQAPLVVVVNQFFARKVFGSPSNVVGRYFKKGDGTRIQIVGVVEDGKYNHIAEDPQPAMFLPVLQAPTSATWLVVRSNVDSGRVSAAIRNNLRNLDASLPVYVTTWSKGLELTLFPSRMAALSLGVMGLIGAMLSITGIFGMAAYSVSKRLRELGIRMALGAQRKEVLQAALARPFRLLAFGSSVGLLLGILASRVLAFIVYQATPRDPLVLAGVVLAMGLLGLVATWIPAQRALSIDPAILLREE
jgi:predicted permease